MNKAVLPLREAVAETLTALDWKAPDQMKPWNVFIRTWRPRRAHGAARPFSVCGPVYQVRGR